MTGEEVKEIKEVKEVKEVKDRKREIPRLRRPTGSRERTGKKKSACSARNDSGGRRLQRPLQKAAATKATVILRGLQKGRSMLRPYKDGGHEGRPEGRPYKRVGCCCRLKDGE